MVTLGQQRIPFASCAIFVSDVMAFFKIGTKSGKNKIYELKWKSPENVGTKSDFSPFNY